MRHRSHLLLSAIVLAALVALSAPVRAEEAAKDAAKEPNPAAELRLDEDASAAAVPDAPELAPLPGEAAPPPPVAASAAAPKGAGGLARGERIHEVVKGDTLWDLAAKYLGSPWKWKAIWERNRFLTNPHFIYPGTKVLVIPPPLAEYSLGGAPAPQAVFAPLPPGDAPSPPAAPSRSAPKGPPTLRIQPDELARSGQLLPAPPKHIGRIRGSESAMLDYAEGDLVYLALSKEIPPGQLLGAYRVRGPLALPGGGKGYVSYLAGVVQVTGKKGKYHLANVRKSFEDLGKGNYLSEEIPAFQDVLLRSTPEAVTATVVANRLENQELSSGDFVFLDRGSDAGVAVGDRFRLFDSRREDGAPLSEGKALLPRPVATAVVVRVSAPYATAQVVDSVRSFQVGVRAQGIPDVTAP